MFFKVFTKLFCYVDIGKKFEKVIYAGTWEIKIVRNGLDHECVPLED